MVRKLFYTNKGDSLCIHILLCTTKKLHGHTLYVYVPENEVGMLKSTHFEQKLVRLFTRSKSYRIDCSSITCLYLLIGKI